MSVKLEKTKALGFVFSSAGVPQLINVGLNDWSNSLPELFKTDQGEQINGTRNWLKPSDYFL